MISALNTWISTGVSEHFLAFMLSSTKSNIATSGVTSLAEALAAAAEDLISPHCYITAAVNYKCLKTPRERNIIAANQPVNYTMTTKCFFEHSGVIWLSLAAIRDFWPESVLQGGKIIIRLFKSGRKRISSDKVQRVNQPFEELCKSIDENPLFTELRKDSRAVDDNVPRMYCILQNTMIIDLVSTKQLDSQAYHGVGTINDTSPSS